MINIDIAGVGIILVSAMLSLLTLNAALITVTIFGIPVYSVQKNSKKRFLDLIQMLRTADHDVVLLQEVSSYYIDRLVAALTDIYPSYCSYKSGNVIVRSEMIILSKYPLADNSYQEFSDATIAELLTVNKGVLSARIEKDQRYYTIINTHLLVMGLFFKPISTYVERIRARQIAQLIQYVKNIQAERTDIVIIGGDFNTGPDASVENYNLLKKYFTDLFARDEQLHGADAIQYTWEPANPLSQKLFNTSEPERIDTFFTPTNMVDILVSDMSVTIIPNTLSDHAGVEAVVGVAGKSS